MDVDDLSDATLGSPAPSLLTPVSPTPATFPVKDVVVPAGVGANGRHYKSPVWLHFQKAQDYEVSRKATCMHCSRTLVASRGSTSTMLHHLQRMHPNSIAGSSGANSLNRSIVFTFPRRGLLHSSNLELRN
jgi:hypothetical protein